MADNYLERKMEELRSHGGRVTKQQSHARSSAKPKGMLCLKFPARRVLIAVDGGIEPDEALKIANLYHRHDCKTALIGEGVRSLGEKIAIDGSHRLLETSDLRGEVRRLYRAWLGIDIFISGEGDLRAEIDKILEEERTRLPESTFYTPRTLIIKEGQVSVNFHGAESGKELSQQLLLASI